MNPLLRSDLAYPGACQRRSCGQAAVELAIALPLFLLLFGFIYQVALLALASDQAQMVANRVAAESRGAANGFATDPARFIDFGVNQMLPPLEFLRGAEMPPPNRSYTLDGWHVEIRTEALLTAAERGLLLDAGSPSDPGPAMAAELMAGLDSGILRVAVWRDLEPIPMVGLLHPQPFRVRGQATGALLERP
jgi:hypothetical protein